MSAPAIGKKDDPAFVLALRCFALHRAVLRHDRNVRKAEQALALWGRGHTISLRAAARSAHPLARQLRAQLRQAAHTRRKRDQSQIRLAATRATDTRAIRAKLMIALTLDAPAAASLLRSALRDLRTS
ncbi:hypothetical protein [Candidatus Viadribacter manganicus]|uniref:Uncharacterized protein n=1 Tax=Candidatus Viadribacter manganicus TaxID=1759059 RepID=A0A1B1AHM5_9PROT|nr:hypothetical protein [Candidatus Viadribacter manganicus]ANP46062.1 hypothetical protein ATE48_09075 [Candidatus Viadribacter manganicus]